ncbi:MAG TPA: sulfatase [Planctomycetota bacterium]|nr:sulfatase [Planctomycetota bacterium]
MGAILALGALTGLAALVPSSCGDARAGYDEPPNVLLFVIDTLRADHLSCYGHQRPTSPNIDRFAADALRFEEVWAPSPRTVASHASLFTSTTPAEHGVWNEPGPGEERDDFKALTPNAICLAEVLESASYQTLGVADGGWLQIDRGLAQGFSVWDTAYEGVDNRVARALEHLAERDRRRPFFLFLHTYQVHTPLLPSDEALAPFDNGYSGVLRDALAKAREASTERKGAALLRGVHEEFFVPLEPAYGPEDVEFLLRLYDAEIATVDRAFARLLEGLEQLDDLANTIVVITSDHGQEFGEHGTFDHAQVYDENLLVPLIVRLPDGHRADARGVRSEPVALIDVMPTLLAELGLPVPPSATGRAIDLRLAPQAIEPRELWGEMRESRPQVVGIEGARRLLFARGDQGEVSLLDPLTGADGFSPLGEADERAARARLDAYRAAAAAHAERFGLEPVQRGRETFMDEKRMAELRQLGYL